MELKHTRFKKVTVVCKGKYITFTDGKAVVEDTALVKELLKNPNIKQVKEEK